MINKTYIEGNNISDDTIENCIDSPLSINYLLESKEYEDTFESKKWQNEIPWMPFNKEWLVKIIPPFAGAVIRFNITESDNSHKWVSVYLDCYDVLGIYGEPYWEVYPFKEESTRRCSMKDINILLELIQESLDEQGSL